jgi:hypothetical protein
MIAPSSATQVGEIMLAGAIIGGFLGLIVGYMSAISHLVDLGGVRAVPVLALEDLVIAGSLPIGFALAGAAIVSVAWGAFVGFFLGIEYVLQDVTSVFRQQHDEQNS